MMTPHQTPPRHAWRLGAHPRSPQDSPFGCRARGPRPRPSTPSKWRFRTLNPQEPLRGLALVDREAGRVAEAVDSLRRALLLAPRYAQLHLDLGIAHDYVEARHEAMAAYATALSLEPDWLQDSY